MTAEKKDTIKNVYDETWEAYTNEMRNKYLADPGKYILDTLLRTISSCLYHKDYMGAIEALRTLAELKITQINP